MKKSKILVILSILLFLPITISAEDINSSTSGTGEGCKGKDSCWQNIGKVDGVYKSLYAVRLTIFNEKAEKVSNSVDITINSIPNNYGVKRNNTITSKIEYLKGSTLTWNEGTLNDLILLPSDVVKNIANSSSVFNKNTQDTFQKVVAQYFWNNGIESVPEVEQKLQYCGGAYFSKCNINYKYYAVFEPTTSVIVGTTKYYGTSYELAKKVWSASWVSSVIRKELPNALYITGEYPSFYNNAKIGSKNGNYNIHKSGYYTQSEVLNFGVGMSVYDWTNKIRPKKPDTKEPETKTCNVNVNINECSESSIYEANYNEKECIVDNEVYAYVKGCNLYCSDEITTNFSGLYNTFVGNNSLGAINSGKYISIKSNPTITIKKTCYQSSKSNECPNIISALNNKLNSDYRTNKIYLNLDGRKYDLIGNASISTNDLNATITYEYKLDSNVNKYIDIETMKGVLQESNITYTNENSMIITSKSYYGKYTYNLDVSETVLNKYTTNSAAMKKLVNTQSTKYNFKNTISINYSEANGNKKNNYVSKDFNETTCSYIKYNSDTGCICPENKCCDSITCEEIECPPDKDGNVCKCTGKYGCYDDGKCTPIEDPNVDNDGNNDRICDPEKRTCFPNLIYRPISLIEPFPGILGNGRTPGSNWNKIYKTSDGKGISYSEYYITSRRGYKDYEIYQAEPLYVIKLDGEKIQAIRKYNDRHNNNYNDSSLSCINGENCISKFLRGQEKDFSINLIGSGTCKNINNYNFNNCIKNKRE